MNTRHLSRNVWSRLNTPSRIVTAAGALAVIGFLAWLWWLCDWRSDIYFLENHAPANWIVYPKPPECMVVLNPEASATFRHMFVLNNKSSPAKLSIRALTRWQLTVNGIATAVSSQEKNWKQATELDVSAQLHSGTNEIVVTVFDTNGPPALWLALNAGTDQIISDTNWNVSLMDAIETKAVVAGAPIIFGKGNTLSEGEVPLPSLMKHLPAMLVFAAFSIALVLRGESWLKNYRERGQPWGSLDSPKAVAIFAAVPAALWLLLFLNNHNFLPRRMGYDALFHLEYIQYIGQHWRLPLANEGWQMYQPPLYYIISALLLLPFDPGNFTPAALDVLRFFGLCVGIAHFVIIFLSLRVLFPGRLGLQWFGLLLAAFLPESLGLSQFTTNETLAAALFSGAMYFCVRILKDDSNSPWLFAGFGLCLGASLLTKVTGVIGLPVFAVALLSRPFLKAHFPSRIRVQNVVLGFAVAFLICGWHYYRVWRRFGNPLTGNWSPATGYHWWMDHGFQTRANYFRFGSCLSYPWFSGMNGFFDGLYATLWGDGMWAGMMKTVDRAPWNYELMSAGYLLALLPTCLIVLGIAVALKRIIRQPDAVWFLLLGVAFATFAAILLMSLKLPYFAQVKAFYGLIAALPLCAFAALGWDIICRQRKALFLAGAAVMGAWAFTSYGSFWIRNSAAETYLILGVSDSDSGRPNAALQKFATASLLAPNDPKIRLRYATQLGRQNPAEMYRLVELNLQEAPAEPETHSFKGVLLAREKQFDPAIDEARKAVALAPDLPSGYITLWIFLMDAGRYREAAEAGREGLRVTPFKADLQHMTGTAFLRANDATNAAIHFAHAVGIKPDKAEYHYDLARALASIGKKTDAIKECRLALELEPGLSGAQDTLQSLENKP